MNTNIKIASGGQTGVDQGALEAAARLRIPSALVLNVVGPRESKSPGEDEGVSFRGDVGGMRWRT